MTTLNIAAMKSLDTMKTVWKNGDAFRNCGDHGGCFWMAGNFFHTSLDAMLQLQVKDAGNFSFGADAIAFFDDRMKNNPDPKEWFKTGIWIDDFGWWGLAFVQAYRHAADLGYDAATSQHFVQRAKDCWTAMNAFWQNDPVKWDVKDGPHAGHYEITGGIPNTLDTAPMLNGRNCVTNEVYWALSNYLTADFGSYYNAPGTQASQFFLQGYEQRLLLDPQNLVYERFYGMPKSDNPAWTWLGDQGLFAISSFNNITGNEKLFDRDQAELVLASVIQNKRTANGVLHEDVAPFSAYTMDYACGKGTFMRYLSYINSYYHGGNSGLSKYDEYIYINARAVWKNRDINTNQFGFYWDGEGDQSKIQWGYSCLLYTSPSPRD